MSGESRAYTLSQISRRLAQAVAADPLLRGAWIVAETSDVRVSGGHCYLELIEKDENGKQLARCRATIWANVFRMISAQFYQATSRQFASDMKVMVYGAVNYSPVYGLSVNIAAINPAYTMGDAMRLRNEMIKRLKEEGIIDLNRTLQWPAFPQRIAIISASNAAGYGDFMNQLYSNPSRLRFFTRLFPATLQGERTAPSIIAALDAIAAEQGHWDCVVIIRGGGGTSDLASFDNYDLAANIAQFPIPVIIGIGHERDITLLDYVANMRVKTPTAAAEWLISRGTALLGALQWMGASMLQALTDRMAGCHRQLAFYQGQLPALANAALANAHKRLASTESALGMVIDRRIGPARARLDSICGQIAQASAFALQREKQKIEAAASMLTVLSPEATLRRGYTITRVNGHAIASASDASAGSTITTQFADGEIASTVNP
ncbi:MAG: exodeoxyribonuclease VII large subunit [Clostridium sp.]|nr:exodeoxyribonuclease VII large subunit [Clostridium sp.]